MTKHPYKTKGTPIRQTSLTDFLSNYEMMMDFRGAWQDGQAGTAWISGLHIADWVWHHPKPRNKDQIELLFLEMESVLDQGKFVPLTDVDDRCWRQNFLVTNLRFGDRFGHLVTEISKNYRRRARS